ncbi:MAG: hypothetical protein SGI77_24830 [Pirellulaceae bacterium]|nr:hypothetical protein [Pirellulaceae bacterium]
MSSCLQSRHVHPMRVHATARELDRIRAGIASNTIRAIMMQTLVTRAIVISKRLLRADSFRANQTESRNERAVRRPSYRSLIRLNKSFIVTVD